MTSSTHKHPTDYRRNEELSGTINIGTNLFYDATEVANVHWREYVYWIGKVFGENSEEYRACLPDTLVWVKKDPCLLEYSQRYFTHPEFNYYPLVGITQKQAEDFAKWRSDRVFERILIDHDIIKEDRTQDKGHHFTIEAYFAGKYQGIKPDTNFRYYPHYRLPTIVEWKTAVAFEDSVEMTRHGDPRPPNLGVQPCVRKYGPSITLAEPQMDYLLARKSISYLRGNVAEWTAEQDVSIGGGWADKAQVMAVKDTSHTIGPNAWTGFRNVCEWKEYKAFR